MHDPEPVKSEMEAKYIAALRAKYSNPARVDLVPAGNDVIQVKRLGYYAF